MRQFGILNHGGLTLCQDGRLSPNVRQSANDLFVTIDETVQRIGNVGFLAEGLDKLLGAPQVVSRHAREQVVNGLELETAVDKVEPLRTIDVHGRAQHALREGLCDAEIGR